ncbi:hypothetical protein FRC17_002766 [Serendipita sp. 399]|nr:hypothetical protein FRC17_002766 [Serendipita sp. 399]
MKAQTIREFRRQIAIYTQCSVDYSSTVLSPSSPTTKCVYVVYNDTDSKQPSDVRSRYSLSDYHSIPIDTILIKRILYFTTVLARVQAFLPQLAAANQTLELRTRENLSSVDIECFEGNESSYIEMNLGLGVFEQRTAHPGVATSSTGNNSTDEDQDDDLTSSSSSSGNRTGSREGTATSDESDSEDSEDESADNKHCHRDRNQTKRRMEEGDEDEVEVEVEPTKATRKEEGEPYLI